MFSFSTLEEFAKIREVVRKKLTEMLVSGVEPFFVAINEAVNNAIFHGNKEDITKKVHLSIIQMPDEIRVVIRDEGTGFVPVQTASEELPENGRGIEIIKHCVDHYYFNLEPSELVLIKKIAG